MSNYERLIMTRKQECGWDEYNDDPYTKPVPKSVTFMVKGTVKVFRPKEVS